MAAVSAAARRLGAAVSPGEPGLGRAATLTVLGPRQAASAAANLNSFKGPASCSSAAPSHHDLLVA